MNQPFDDQGLPRSEGSHNPLNAHMGYGAQPPAGRGARRPAGGHAPSDARQLRPMPDLTKSEDIIRVRKKRRKHSTAKKAVLGVVIALVCVLGLAGGAAALYLNSLNQSLSFDNKEEEQNLKAALAPVTTEAKEKPFYMLLLGSDAREGDSASRSDVNILTRIDPASGTVTMVSIPRDTMIDLPGHGRQKINAAYAFDGAAGAVNAVSSFAGVPISHYAEIHFQELEQLVDALGGVWVDVPLETPLSSGTLQPGNQLLNGQQALGFARERYAYERGDFQRTDNQRLLVQAIIKQVLAMPALELPGIVQQLAGCVTTDYELGDIVSLAQKFQQASGLTMYSAMTPSSTMTIDGVSYVITQYPDWTEMMQRVDAGADPNGTSAVAGGSSEAGAPAAGTTVDSSEIGTEGSAGAAVSAQ